MTTLEYSEISAVSTANAHNPTILNPDFLSNQGVVPADWQVAETFTTPPLSIVRYLNGVVFEARPDKLIITESVNNDRAATPQVFDLMKKYVVLLPYTPYIAAGLNCKVSVKTSHPAEAILKRFVLPEAISECDITGVRLRVTTGCETDAKLFVEIDEGLLKRAEDDSNGEVIYSCNFHHDTFDTTEDLSQILDNWGIYKPFLDEYIPKLYRSTKGNK